MNLTLLKNKLIIGKNKKKQSFNPKIQAELSELVGVKEISALIGKEVLYWIKEAHDDGYAVYAKILGVSPNGKFVRLADLDDDLDYPPYYRSIEAIEIVDVLN